MSIAKLIRHFEALGQARVEVADVVAQFRKMMPNESIRVTGVDLPVEVLRGAHYRYIHKPTEGSAVQPGEMIQVIYSDRQPVEWQRLVICKELIHIFDGKGVMTDAPEEVTKLIKQLSGEEKKKIVVGSSIAWFFDELAEYQAISMLFPFGLREALNGRALDEELVARLAEELVLPSRAIYLVLSEEWKVLRETLLA